MLLSLVWILLGMLASASGHVTNGFVGTGVPNDLYFNDILSDVSAMSVSHCAFTCQHTTGCRAILYKTSDSPDTSHCYVTTPSYSGDVNTTMLGDQCQRWDTQTPHTHSMTADMMPDPDLATAGNYCRNPNSNIYCVWCHTMVERDFKTYCCNVWRCFLDNTNCRLLGKGGASEMTVPGYVYYALR